MDVRDIVVKFGGQTALAGKLGIKQSAVAYWVKKGSIPIKWHQKILSVAKELGVTLELYPPPLAPQVVVPLKSVDTDLVMLSQDDGVLTIGNVQIPCAVLEDETRVISDRGVSKAMGTKRGGAHWRRMKGDGALNLPPYISASNLNPFIPNDLAYILTHPVKYKLSKAGATANGLLATALPKVLQVWANAFKAGVLVGSQVAIGEQSIRLLEGLDEVAMVALVDEATGFQRKRGERELQQLLSAYVLPEHRPYVTDELTKGLQKEIYRVYGWEYKNSNQGPRYVGKLIRQLIYEKLPSSVLPKLDELNPTNGATYQRKYKHRQHLTEEIGLAHYRSQLTGVMALLRATPSSNPNLFQELFKRAYGDQYSLDL